MKKALIFFLITLCFMNMSGFAYAEDSGAWPPFVKLGRGLANIVTSPLEIPKNIGDANKKDGTMAAFTWGVLQGVADTVGRIAVGAYETATFLLPIPENYDPILTDPEYFLQDVH